MSPATSTLLIPNGSHLEYGHEKGFKELGRAPRGGHVEAYRFTLDAFPLCPEYILRLFLRIFPVRR